MVFDFHLASTIIRSLPHKRTSLSYMPGLAVIKILESTCFLMNDICFFFFFLIENMLSELRFNKLHVTEYSRGNVSFPYTASKLVSRAECLVLVQGTDPSQLFH